MEESTFVKTGLTESAFRFTAAFLLRVPAAEYEERARGLYACCAHLVMTVILPPDPEKSERVWRLVSMAACTVAREQALVFHSSGAKPPVFLFGRALLMVALLIADQHPTLRLPALQAVSMATCEKS